MWIKKRSHPVIFKRTSFKWGIIVLLSFFILFSLYISSVLLVSRQKHHILLLSLKTAAKAPVNILKSLSVIPERMDIDIQFEDVEKLRAQIRATEETRGFMTTFGADTSYVPISITYKGKKYKAEARLKGNWWDARISDRWSFRIRLKDDEYIKGLKAFSIHSPIVKGFITEWIFQHLAEKEEVMNIYYDYLKVVVNGEQGIYAIEEHLTNEYPEKERRPESVIIKFDEYWMYWAMLKDYENISDQDLETVYPVSPIEAVQMNKVKENPLLYRYFLDANRLLNGFRHGNMLASEVFKIDEVATLFAIADLMGHPHNVEMRNMRFYFNPLSGKLEPIAYDQHRIVQRNRTLIGEKWGSSHDPDTLNWKSEFFKDPEFYTEYVKALNRISQPRYIDKIYGDLKKDFNRARNIVFKDFPFIDIPYWKTMEQNAVIIQKKIKPGKLFDAYFQNGKIHIVNVHTMPIQLRSVLYKGKALSSGNSTLIKGSSAFRRPESFEVELDMEISDPETLSVECAIPGINHSKTEKVKSQEWVVSDNTQYGSYLHSKNLTIDHDEMTIRFKDPVTVLSKDLTFPAQYTLIVQAGQSIQLDSNTNLRCYGKIEFNGSNEDPVYLTARGPGTSLSLIESPEKSFFRYVIFKNLGIDPVKNGLRGAISVYGSNVEFEECNFESNVSEDALHLIQSDFKLVNCRFRDIYLDGLDSDFSTGSIEYCTFENIGDDAIDFSGTEAQLQYITINHFVDKGISAGEQSRIGIQMISIRNGKTAIASKDSSSVTIEDYDFSECTYNLAAYQKKPQYGPALISIPNNSTISYSKIHIEIGSLFRIGDEEMKGTEEDLALIFN